MLRGIDISNWQSGIVPSTLDIDFCICKATEGIGYTDPDCDMFVTDCIDSAILWGFYHFARENDPKAEADWFYRETSNYFNHGIPVLDYETQNADDCQWCEQFMVRVHELSGVWPLLYISASQVYKFADSWIPQTCGLWLAGYPWANPNWTNEDMPYQIGSWDFCAIWQFTSSLRLAGYNGNLDGNIAYMDADAWRKYACVSTTDAPIVEKPYPRKSDDDLAVETILGEYGSGDDRKRLLGSRYDAVQDRVNSYYARADECITGIWGNGWNRREALQGAGYNPDIVQRIVNEKMA